MGLVNSLGMKLAYIPAGSFLMGSPDTQICRWEDETQHEVSISKPFYMGMMQVMQNQWQEVMEDKPSYFEGDNLPVDGVSWNDAQEFCRKLSEKEVRRYRLPTEAEWEYACRAGSMTVFHTGNDEQALSEAGWYDGNSETYDEEQARMWELGLDSNRTKKKTHPVGQKKPNAWGLYDMHGNVWEWCSDWYGYYLIDDVRDPSGPAAGNHRVLRGGSYDNNPWCCRSSSRNSTTPDVRHGLSIGFRLVLESE